MAIENSSADAAGRLRDDLVRILGEDRILTGDRERRFYDSETRLHHHFYNVDTGELTDIDDSEISFGRLPELPDGTRGESVEVLIKVRTGSD